MLTPIVLHLSVLAGLVIGVGLVARSLRPSAHTELLARTGGAIVVICLIALGFLLARPVR